MKLKKNKLIVIVVVLMCYITSGTPVVSQEFSVLQMYGSAKRILEEGIRDGRMDRIKESLVIFHRGLNLNPNYFDVLKDLAIAYLMLGDLRLSRKYTLAGLKQSGQDIELIMLDIFLDLTEDKSDVAKAKIDAVKLKYPFSIEILYLEMMYSSLLNDRAKVEQLFLQMKKKFGSDNEHVYIYTVIQSLQDNIVAFEQESIVNKLSIRYVNDPWILWLLSDYYIMSGDRSSAFEIIERLKKSQVPKLEKYAYEQSFIDEFKLKNYNRAVEIATIYTEMYPLERKSWEYLGIVYYAMQKHTYAERAFARGQDIDSDNFLLNFMYDTVLKEGDDVLKVVRDERTREIESEIQFAYDNGNINRAKLLIDKLLYINPLLTFPKRMRARIYEQEGNFYNAQLELEGLVERGYDEKNINELLLYYKEKTSFDVDYLDNLDERANISSKIWEFELDVIHHETGGFVNELYGDFLKTFFMYNFRKSPYIQWNTARDGSQAKYIFEVQLIDRIASTIVTVTLKDKSTEANIYSFNKIYEKGNHYDRIVDDLKKVIDQMVPKIAEVVFYDKIKSDIIINTFQLQDVEVGDVYTLYPNKNSYSFNLMKEGNHFMDDLPPLGNITMKNVTSRFSLGKIEKNETMSSEEYLRIIQNVRKGDFILIPAGSWDQVATDNVIVRNIKTQTEESIMSFYFKNIYVISLFFKSDIE